MKVRIPAHWNGPPTSANGGYTCGLVAGLLGAPSAAVSLRAPPPLEQTLDVEREGDRLLVRDGAQVVAAGWTVAAPALEAPPAVGLEEARAASRSGFGRWSAAHPFPTCVVCGPDRDDGLRIFPGPLSAGLHGAVWEPGSAVGVEQVWAALDCPSSSPVANWGEGPPIVLARLHAHVERLPRGGEELAVVSWALGTEGRKREAASALLAADGSVLARARALWIELRPG
ncbi:MAG: hypothetical protein M3350_02115 [Actinomycetota bacterium]|nr:hypothetical protein [Actinomycetota bacterium]MDQ3719568.1 hypothetical protein [Actinomycetota bacterium]